MVKKYFTVIAGLAGLLYITSCTHDPIFIDDDMPMDTTMMPIDTGMTAENSCHPDTVYFERDVLPILQTNCAKSGCHDALTAVEGIVLDSYANVIASEQVDPFDADNSDLYERIVEDDPYKIMPPFPNSPLSDEQATTIQRWINQGALNLDCEEDAGGCDSDMMSFSGDIFPILQNHCIGCHAGPAPLGGFTFDNYTDVLTIVNNGGLSGSINFEAGFTPMPFNLPKMDDCQIEKIDSWIADGAPNN